VSFLIRVFSTLSSVGKNLQEPHENVEFVALLLGLHGFGLIANWFLTGLWPLWPLIIFALFPFLDRLAGMQVVSGSGIGVLMPLIVFYGLGELIIAWGMWQKKNWSRIALMAHAGIYLVYGACDVALSSLSSLSGRLGAVAYAAIGAFLIWHLTRENIKAYFSD
jgi:hypothetical protein